MSDDTLSAVTNTIPNDLRLVPHTPEWFESLRETLGEAACRQLGFYVIPPEWMLARPKVIRLSLRENAARQTNRSLK